MKNPEGRPKGTKLSKQTKEKIRKAMLGRKITWGHKISKSHKGILKPKVSIALKNSYKAKIQQDRFRFNNPAKGCNQKGEKNRNWTGGVWDWWRKQALERDNYTCQNCGFSEVQIMTVDHITPRTVEPDLEKVMSNLMTLCPNCHVRKTLADKKKYHHIFYRNNYKSQQ